MAQSLPTFPSFDVHSDPSSIAQRWTKYVRRFQNLLVAMDIADKKRQRALLIHYGGEEVSDILDTLPDTGEDLEGALEKLNPHFNPRRNIDYETYVFRSTKQNVGETMETYSTRLRQLALTCEFSDQDREIKGQLIQGCSSNRIRRRILRPDLKLMDILNLARAMEQSERQAKTIEQPNQPIPETVNTVLNKSQQNRTTTAARKSIRKNAKPSSNKPHSKYCRYCGYAYPHPEGKTCPAKGKACGFCHKFNHFESVCRQKKRQQHDTGKFESVKQVRSAAHLADSSSDDEYVFGVYSHSDGIFYKTTNSNCRCQRKNTPSCNRYRCYCKHVE
ncbi:uncharacterized protein LOC135481275 [Liolophura sinensis]|uniref:uncharacterized protein LOC135481275 n=1 Tax=Liolophura sinensis TaxID=3198878 RepID=UPI0031588D1E